MQRTWPHVALFFFVTCVHKDNNDHDDDEDCRGDLAIDFFCEGKLYGNIAFKDDYIFKTIKCTKTSNHSLYGR